MAQPCQASSCDLICEYGPKDRETAVSSSISLLQNCLEAAGKVDTRQTLLTGFVQHIKVFSGASAVGIRLRERDKI